MGHIALYREWRPKTFDEVVEQKYTVSALKQAVISDNIAHAYLFSGTRGTGKTTMAQIFSRAINCLSPEQGNPCNKCRVCKGILDGSILDVIEMDAASNNNVDTIRRLCDEIVFSPSVARFKVYIIDEVHMLSTGAFNALLKTLEEPPAHAVFILATTEQHRIPPTILSRCQRYEFRRITVSGISERLKSICTAENISASDDALHMISKLSDGALRDAISLLDQADSAFSEGIGKEDILSLVGLVDDDFMLSLAKAIAMNCPDDVLELVEKLILDGRDITKFTSDLALYFRNVMICHVSKSPEQLINYPENTVLGMKQVASLIPLERVINIIKELSSLVPDLKWSFNPRITFEISIIRIMDTDTPGSIGPAPKKAKDTADEPEEKTKKKTPEKEEPVPDDDSGTDETFPDFPDEPVIEEENEDFFSAVPDEPSYSDNKTEDISENTTVENTDSPETEKSGIPDISVLWPKLLDKLVEDGQMTLYLFLLPAKPEIAGNNLLIEFGEEDKMNYSEVSSEENTKTISKAVYSIIEMRLGIEIKLLSDKEITSDEKNESEKKNEDNDVPENLKNLKRSAEEMGISFYMED